MPSTKAWLLNRNLVGQPCGAYLEIQSEVKVVFHENPLDKRELIEVHRGFADVYSNIRHIQRLVKSSLSTSATRRPVTCACSWEFSCFVLGTGNSGATPTSINVNNLNEDEFASWMKWIDLFYNDGPLFQRIEIGLERLSDSIYGFQTMQDGLINAAIALENLFGITQGELTHRLSLAVARTLGDSLDSREYLYKQTQNLYKMRSKVVHGNTLNSKNILELRKLLAEAIDIYKRCLDQIVHHHRTDLMDNKIATIITLSD